MTSDHESGLPKPSPVFIENYQEYLRLVSIGAKERAFEEEDKRIELKQWLEAEFMKAFHLTPDKGKLADRFYHRLTNTPYWLKEFFHHVKFFRRGRNIVIAAHPYYLDEAELARWCTGVNAGYKIVDAWRHYES